MEIDARDLEKRWRADGKDDIGLARHLLGIGKHTRAMFFAHLALEKALKALIIRATGGLPPRIHNLLTLADRAGVTLDDNRQRFLSAMNEYQMAGRYLQIEKSIDPRSAIEDLEAAERVFEWLSSL